MKRWSLVLLIPFASLAFAQDGARPLFSSDLVHWSYMQQPQAPGQEVPRQTPTPDPRPETQPAQNPTSTQTAQPSSTPSQSTATSNRNATAQDFVGTINKETSGFVLKVSESMSYQLDNSDAVQQYEGKRVRVTGTLDSSANLIHVDKVEPIS